MVRILDIEDYAINNNIPIMQKDGIEFLVNYIKKNNIKNILEIGTAIGYSAIKMALVDKSIKITTIERDENRYALAIKNIKDFGLENQIHVILGDALDVEISGIYDLIFIDAAKSGYIKYFEKYSPYLKTNGVVVSDNLKFHGLVEGNYENLSRNVKGIVRKLKKYTNYLKENKDYDTIFYDLGDGVSISRKLEK